MSGYIGVRAKKRRRNLVIFFITIIILFLFYYIVPTFKLNETMPSNDLLPVVTESFSSEIFTIEELESKIFDRDQKIIFRNSEIKKIKKKFKILAEENKQLTNSILDLNSQLNLTSSSSKEVENIDKQLEVIKIDNNKERQKLNDIILKITNEKNDLYKRIEKVSSESEISKKEYKITAKKYQITANENIQLKSLQVLLEKKIKEHTKVIDKLNLLIQKLKDNYHRR